MCSKPIAHIVTLKYMLFFSKGRSFYHICHTRFYLDHLRIFGNVFSRASNFYQQSFRLLSNILMNGYRFQWLDRYATHRNFSSKCYVSRLVLCMHDVRVTWIFNKMIHFVLTTLMSVPFLATVSKLIRILNSHHLFLSVANMAKAEYFDIKFKNSMHKKFIIELSIRSWLVFLIRSPCVVLYSTKWRFIEIKNFGKSNNHLNINRFYNHQFRYKMHAIVFMRQR